MGSIISGIGNIISGGGTTAANNAAAYANPVAGQEGGYQAMLQQVIGNPNSITSTPGYEFGLSQGAQQLKYQEAASGDLASGTADINAVQYGQGYATNYLNTYENLLTNLGGFNIANPGAAAGSYANLMGGQTGPLAALQGAGGTVMNMVSGLFGGSSTSGIGGTSATVDSGAAGETAAAAGAGTTADAVGSIPTFSAADIAGGGGADAAGAAAAWVICTELREQGLLERDLYEAGAARALTLPAQTLRGYHLWAIPYTRWMRRSALATRMILPLARARNTYLLGGKSVLGMLSVWLGEPLCHLLGGLIERPPVWQSLYSGE